ncbi:hypothetical protein IEQ34_015299 [Dendrobium chrysotoxum]|uniref:VQ domain-containing protein n=1 Tax=Dendrobium chrysotoxum TaxID=161865 RepID=A0AAV7GIF0_DENCH|nr:hypothetical protein IEQ34_015299 [Dendrobium chrysotoxum]
MDSGDSNIMRFSSSIAAAGDTFFQPLASSPSSLPLRLPSPYLPPLFTSSTPTPTTPSQLPPTSTAPRISKKRSRPSRRAPTTVLATDTSNFRAMVQVFTGIPSAPLSSSFSLHPSLNFSPQLLLRPFSPKLQTTNSLSPTSSISPNYQTPINAQQTPSSLFQSIPPFASPEGFLTPEKFGMIKGVDGLVSMAGSEEVEEDFRGEKGLESVRFACRGGMLDSWICSSD